MVAGDGRPPVAKKHPVTDAYHGVTVTDDYRWLEDWQDPAVKQWSDAENAYARSYLDSLPGRKKIEEQVKSLMGHPSPIHYRLTWRGGTLFALRTIPPQQQASLVAMESPDNPAAARVILDPAAMDSSGQTAIDFYVPSTDGKLVAVSMSKGGSESGDVHVYETATGKALPDVIPRVNGGTAGGSLAWNADGSGFWYTRYPRAGEKPEADLGFYQQVWFHRLGSNTAEDTYSLGRDFPRIAEIEMKASEDGRYVLARMSNGDGGEYAHYLLAPGKGWSQIATYADEVVDIEFGQDGALYFLSRRHAPMGRILKGDFEHPVARDAREVIPESMTAIRTLVPAATRLYLVGLEGGPSVIRIFDLGGKPQGTVPIAPVSAVYQALRCCARDQLLFRMESYVSPSAWFTVESGAGGIKRTGLRETSPADFSNVEVSRVFATSKDGTRVPLTILRRKDVQLDGKNPTLLTGYGGYGISLSPFFDPVLQPLFQRGVVVAVANLRGGGEYGDAWHQSGNLTRKQHVFDDFIACARYLIDRRYTNPDRLAIEGGSNGGLLMGAAFTQHPELFRAVVSHVGIYDMLRFELSPNGAFNVTEFGTVKEADRFRALYAYSPYHHVVDGTQYPAILFLTGANDPRVDPMNSRKMTARLQASGTKRPVMLRTSSTSGHGIGTALDEQIAETTDVYVFLFAQWGLE